MFDPRVNTHLAATIADDLLALAKLGRLTREQLWERRDLWNTTARGLEIREQCEIEIEKYRVGWLKDVRPAPPPPREELFTEDRSDMEARLPAAIAAGEAGDYTDAIERIEPQCKLPQRLITWGSMRLTSSIASRTPSKSRASRRTT